jgi:programmed cell death 6-interacting protein
MACRYTGESFIRALRSLDIPAALDVLDRPVGLLPPSLRGKADKVRPEDRMHRIPALIKDVQRIARRNSAAPDEVRFIFWCLIAE